MKFNFNSGNALSIVAKPLTLKLNVSIKGVGRNFFRGGGNGKKDWKLAKNTEKKHYLASSRGATKKDQK